MTDDSTTQRMRRLRIRNWLDNWTVAIVVALLVLAILGGWVAYQTHTNPGTETEERTVATWSERATVSHAAEVQLPNPVFEQGQVLSDRPVYFTGVTPELQADYEYSYDASEHGEVDVQLEPVLRIQSVDDDGAAYWTVTEELDGHQAESVSPGETVSTTVELEPSEILADIEQIQENLGSTIGTTEVELQFDVRMNGAVNDDQVANAHQSSLVLDPDETTYSVETDDDITETHERTEVVESERTYGPLRSYGPVLLLSVALLGLLGLAAGRHQGWTGLSPAERIALEQHQQRQRFDEWISTGTVPDGERSGPPIELDSLEDLVDVAIDTNERVIEEKHAGRFFVPGDGRYYTYDIDGPTETDWSANADEPSVKEVIQTGHDGRNPGEQTNSPGNSPSGGVTPGELDSSGEQTNRTAVESGQNHDGSEQTDADGTADSEH